MAAEKPLEWAGSSKRDLMGFPDHVRRTVGYALGVAQLGGKHPSAKPWPMARKTETSAQVVTFERSRGNVFADLGLAEPDELKTKLVLAVRLNESIQALSLKQAEVAKRLGIAQPNVSALVNYRLDNFSSEKLLEFFNALGYDVDLLIRPSRSKGRGAMQVLMAL